MNLHFTQQLTVSQDVRHQVRHLSWFRSSFTKCARLAEADWGIRLSVNEPALANAFLDWAIAFTEQRQHALPSASLSGAQSRKDFATFAAGMLLKELIRNRVCTASEHHCLTIPADANARVAEIMRFWPEGFLYTSYCLSVLNAVMVQDFDSVLEVEPAADDIRTWWTFRENTTEDAALAIGFLDMFVGRTPNWSEPEYAPARAGMQPLPRLTGSPAAAG
jgi:hypothetical protein